MGSVYYWRRAAGRVSPRRARYFSCAAKKSTQKKAAPAACDPSRCEGQPVSWRLRGVPRNSLRAVGAPFGQTRQASSRCTGTLRCQCHPTNTTPQAHAKGGMLKQPTANSQQPSGHRYARPGLGAERSDGTRLLSFPSECAEEHRVWAGQLHRRVQLLRELTHRVCLNGAPWRVVSFAVQPIPEHHRLPAAKRRDAVSRATFFWVLFLVAKKSTSPAGRNPASKTKQRRRHMQKARALLGQFHAPKVSDGLRLRTTPSECAEHHRLPAAKRRDAVSRATFFWVLFFGRRSGVAKKSTSPAGGDPASSPTPVANSAY